MAVDAAAAGHQFFPDIDAHAGRLAVVWQDSRTDPAYSVQHPIGNTRDAQGRAISSGTNIVHTFVALHRWRGLDAAAGVYRGAPVAV